MRLLRVIVFLLVAALLALTGYAYFGDMSADPRPTRVPVRLDLGTAPPAPPAPAAAAAPAEAPLDPAAEADAPDDPDALD
ncbi:MAG TPA: hypothetical protein PKA35_14680 [Paracoccus solventivorans]|uniref:hypothetical protein n=1 Tax=Paracoccus solventivorans TaxID=53463 RepID=UPI002D1260F4|nr:hypothetical protein [Paracoccus solventivorans]HMM10342.1 hypothetical protein [Paracoccus solventivorans]